MSQIHQLTKKINNVDTIIYPLTSLDAVRDSSGETIKSKLNAINSVLARKIESTDIKTINHQSILGEGDIEIKSSTPVTEWSDSPSDENTPSEKLVYDTTVESERVVAESLIDLNSRISNISLINITSNGVTHTLQEWIDIISTITIEK